MIAIPDLVLQCVPCHKNPNTKLSLQSQNNPLFVQTYRSDNVVTGMQEDPIKFHYILHCSLDAFEEKGEPSNAKGRCLVRATH